MRYGSKTTLRYGSKTTLFCFFAYESFPPLARWFAIYDPKRLYYMNFLFVILVPDAEGKISTYEKFSIYFPLTHLNHPLSIGLYLGFLCISKVFKTREQNTKFQKSVIKTTCMS